MRVLMLTTALAVLSCSKPQPVEVTPRSVQVTSIEPQGAQLALVLDVRNPNAFAITASDVRGTVTIENGGELGRGAATGTVTVPAEQTVSVPTRVSVNWTNLAVLAPFALSAQPVPFRIDGSARIGGERLNIELPFTIAGQLTREQVVQAGLRGAGSLMPGLVPGATP